MFDPQFELPKATQRRFTQLVAHLPPGDVVLAAVALTSTPPVGSENSRSAASGLRGLVSRELFGGGLPAPRWPVRRGFLAATADRAILFSANSLWRRSAIVRSFELDDIDEIDDAAGDPFIELRGQRYWTRDADQVYRLRRVLAAHRSNRSTATAD